MQSPLWVHAWKLRWKSNTLSRVCNSRLWTRQSYDGSGHKRSQYLACLQFLRATGVEPRSLYKWWFTVRSFQRWPLSFFLYDAVLLRRRIFWSVHVQHARCSLIFIFGFWIFCGEEFCRNQAKIRHLPSSERVGLWLRLIIAFLHLIGTEVGYVALTLYLVLILYSSSDQMICSSSTRLQAVCGLVSSGLLTVADPHQLLLILIVYFLSV